MTVCECPCSRRWLDGLIRHQCGQLHVGVRRILWRERERNVVVVVRAIEEQLRKWLLYWLREALPMGLSVEVVWT